MASLRSWVVLLGVPATRPERGTLACPFLNLETGLRLTMAYALPMPYFSTNAHR
jgi:hypothetical protein